MIYTHDLSFYKSKSIWLKPLCFFSYLKLKRNKHIFYLNGRVKIYWLHRWPNWRQWIVSSSFNCDVKCSSLVLLIVKCLMIVHILKYTPLISETPDYQIDSSLYSGTLTGFLQSSFTVLITLQKPFFSFSLLFQLSQSLK